MSGRTYEQLRQQAYARYLAIRADNDDPAAYCFVVTPLERARLFDRAPLMLPEMNMERTTFCGMRIYEMCAP